MSAEELALWKSVDAELPDAESTVLLACPEWAGEAVAGFYDGTIGGKRVWRQTDALRITETVTHWRVWPDSPFAADAGTAA